MGREYCNCCGCVGCDGYCVPEVLRDCSCGGKIEIFYHDVEEVYVCDACDKEVSK